MRILGSKNQGRIQKGVIEHQGGDNYEQIQEKTKRNKWLDGGCVGVEMGMGEQSETEHPVSPEPGEKEQMVDSDF